MIVIAFPEVAGLPDSRLIDDYASSRGWSGYMCSVEETQGGRTAPIGVVGAVSSSARALAEVYTREAFGEADPVQCWVREHSRPVIWTVDEFRKTGDRRQRELFSLVADAGFLGGVSIPLFGPANLRGTLVALDSGGRIGVDRAIEEIKESGPLGNALIDCACRHSRTRVAAPVLTGREIECLKWVALGKTSWEISLILNISARTVDFHVQNAMSKLDANSRQQAIYNAMNLGILPAAAGGKPTKGI